jgi:Holliday junction DNA helicase RuvA
MISTITGVVRFIGLDRAVIEVGGVGLSVSITGPTITSLNLGAQAHLFTSLVVREDSLTLFGFLDEESRTTFELVQTVSGIGPKVALAILGAHTPDSLARAIAQEDIKSIEKVPGIGKKGAQRLVLELKGKITDFGGSTRVQSHQPVWREQLTSALISLGFTAKDSDASINEMISSLSEDGVEVGSLELSELLKKTLQTGRRS